MPISEKIQLYVDAGHLSPEQAATLTKEQHSNLEKKYISTLITQHILPMETALALEREVAFTLDDPKMFNLLRDNIITLEQALELSEMAAIDDLRCPITSNRTVYPFLIQGILKPEQIRHLAIAKFYDLESERIREDLTTGMLDVNDFLSDVVKPPVLSSHEETQAIIKLNNALGYIPKDEGICFGFIFRRLEAHFLNQDQQFNERIERIVQIVREGNLVDTFNTMKAKKGINLTPDDKVLLDILAFYDSMELYHLPHMHTDLFNTSMTLTQDKFEEVSTIAASDAVRALGGLQSAYSEGAGYNQHELTDYLHEISTVLDRILPDAPAKASVGITITMVDIIPHIIALTYHGNDQWGFMNTANNDQLDKTRVYNTKLVALLIMKAFYLPTQIRGALQTSIVTTQSNPYLDELTKTLAQFKQHNKSDERYKCKGLALLAAFHDDVDLIRKLTKQHYDLNEEQTNLTGQMRDSSQKQVNPMKPIHVAAAHGSADVIAELVEKVDSNSIATKDELTPAHIAACLGHSNVIHELAKHGSDLNQLTVRGETPIFLAAKNGQLATVKALITCGANVNIPYVSSADQLRKAVSVLGLEQEKRLNQFINQLDGSVDQNYIPITAKDVASIMGYSTIVKLIHEHADNLKQRSHDYINFTERAIHVKQTHQAKELFNQIKYISNMHQFKPADRTAFTKARAELTMLIKQGATLTLSEQGELATAINRFIKKTKSTSKNEELNTSPTTENLKKKLEQDKLEYNNDKKEPQTRLKF